MRNQQTSFFRMRNHGECHAILGTITRSIQKFRFGQNFTAGRGAECLEFDEWGVSD